MIVLIDDDLLIRKSWQMAFAKAGQDFLAFDSVEAFLESSDIPKDATVYIDYQLGQGQLGTIASKELYERGYQQLYLSTGYELAEHPEWIQGVVGKRPPI